MVAKVFISQYYEVLTEKKLPTIFLDRDGTIIKDVGNLYLENKIKLYKRAIKGIKLLNSLGYRVIVITNQPVIARGWLTENKLLKINNEIQKKIKKENAVISAIYSCPHHKNANIKKYRKNCLCRKPNILMLEKASKDFKIDFENSFMIGDRLTDVLAGKNFGLKTILIKPGYESKDKESNSSSLMVKTFLSAVKLIIRQNKK